jgi:hypothetical protein
MLLRTFLLAGAGASLTSIAAITLAARREGVPMVQPVNASSHVFWGAQAGAVDRVDVRHSATGAAINVGAGFFWGGVMALLNARRARSDTAATMADAATVAALATTLDYGLLPRRLSPGWELALSRRSVAVSMVAMAVGLAAGTALARRRDRS